jgi:hypothetical protein
LCATSAELTLIFRALTEASAARLKMLPGITAVNRIIAKDVESSKYSPNKQMESR